MNARAVLAVVLLIPALQGCFTLSLWGAEETQFEDQNTGRVRDGIGWPLPAGSERKPDAVEIARRILLTPFTLVLDLVTLPIQVGLMDDEEP